MRLIVAEKPSVGIAYAHALGVKGKKDGYIEGGEYIITWCIGHLVEPASAEVYDGKYKKWNIADLPILPQTWEYSVTPDKSKQFDIVKSLMHDKRVTEIINGCDCGREGELIFRLVYNKANCKLPIKRLWISSMEESAIIDGVNNLRDGADFKNLYHSALCRSKADWIIGINATRLFTKLYNKKLNVGRVQTPTLAMLTERGAAITGFVKEKYYNVGLNDIAVSEKITAAADAEQVKAACDNQKAIVTSVKRERKTINPPRLYDLTTLQRESNRLYGFTAQQTLDYVQSLYEMRLVTYPRTDSQFLTEDMTGTATSIIKIALEKVPQFSGFSYTPDVARVINSKKVNDHFAIIPTAELAKKGLDNIPDGERKILLLIVNKLLCATADKHEYESVTAVIECGGYSFTAKGKTVISDGWKAIERLFSGRDENEEKPLDLTEGQELMANCSIGEHFTSPPKAFTEDTLLSSMERASADDFSDNTERSGLGTPATRAGIIEKLIKSGFVRRDKKSLHATDEGAELVSIIPDCIKSAQLTAEWENGLALIADGSLDPAVFMGNIETLVKGIVSSASENVKPELVAKSAFSGGEKIGECPRCNNYVCETLKAYSCNAADCGFIIWKNNKFFENAKQPLTKEIAAALLKDGKVTVKGLYSQKTGKKYTAAVCLEDTGKYVNFRLEF